MWKRFYRKAQYQALEQRTPMASDIAGTHGASAEVFDLNQDPFGAGLYASTVHDGDLYYIVSKDDGNVDLWKTDGTHEGTTQIKAIPSRQTNPPNKQENRTDTWEIASVGDHIYFTFDKIGFAPDQIDQYLTGNERVLWQSDGTTTGTSQVTAFGSWNPISISALTAELHDSEGQLLMVVESASAGTTRSSLWTAQDGEATAYSDEFRIDWRRPIQDMVAFNNAWYFIGFDHRRETGVGLWKTTPNGETTLVKQVAYDHFRAVPDPGSLARIGDRLFFAAASDDDSSDAGLWTSDGTTDGTVFLKTIAPNRFLLGPDQFWETDGSAFFVAKNSIWTSDGTEAGTTQVADLSGDAYFHVLPVDNGNTVYLSTRSELWEWKPGQAGRLLHSFDGGFIRKPSFVSGKLIFEVLDGCCESTLWSHDSTTEETLLLGEEMQFAGELNGKAILYDHGTLLELGPGQAAPRQVHQDVNFTDGVRPTAISATENGVQFFSEQDGQLYHLDATTNRVQSVDAMPPIPFTDSGTLREPTTTGIGKDLFVLGDSGVWRVDTESGEARVLAPFSRSNYAATQHDDRLAFLKRMTLYWTDGSQKNVNLIADAPDEMGSPAYLPWSSRFTSTSTHYFALAKDPKPFHSAQLWVRPHEGGKWESLEMNSIFAMVATEDRVYFIRYAGNNRYELWESGGTEETTNLLLNFEGNGGDGFRFTTQIQIVENDIYISHDAALWKYDPTVPRRLEMLKRFVHSLRPTELTANDGKLFFVAGELETGNELWVSDGTKEGTLLAADLRDGSGSSDPHDLTIHADKLYFAANDVVHGEELWSIDLNYTTEPPRADANGDGEVDTEDFLILAENFNSSTDSGQSAGDFDDNGDVNFLDFLILANQFTKTTNSHSWPLA